MRLILISIIFIFSISVNGQVEPKTTKNEVSPKTSIKVEKAVTDTTFPTVVYNKTKTTSRQPAIYLNGEFINQTVFITIDHQLIESIEIDKNTNEIEIEGKKYFGKIFIKMKEEYNPQFISLTDLKEKYTNLTSGPTIFYINNNILNEDYDQFLVDEKYILRIIVDTFENEKEKLNFNIIRLLTKTKENIEKSNEIWVRGLGETVFY
jgi:hypothetical protein